MKKILWLHVLLVAHTIGRSPCRDALQLILENISPSIALYDEKYLPPAHLIEKFVPVSTNLAYDRFECFVGASTFFCFFVSVFSFISVSMVEGTMSQSFCISTTALIISMTSVREAL